MNGISQVPGALPAGSCDCQVHVFGPVEKYPPLAKRNYDPPPATVGELVRMQDAVGLERAVIAQATIYGTDHSLLVATLRAHPRFRGVAVVNDSVSDDELAALHEAGVRAARFGLGSSIQSSLTRDEFDRSIARIGALGWHARIATKSDDLSAHEEWLRALKLPVVLDHFAGVDPNLGPDQPGYLLALDLLRQPNWWIMLSNGDRRSAAGPPWDDMMPFARALYAAAPDRMLWASDWPHVLYAKSELPREADLLAFLRRAVPDEAAFRKVLVDNPARLYGF